MKTITLEELRQVKAGDKVKIVSEIPVCPRCGWANATSGDSNMDTFLGKICTVKSIEKSYDGLPVLHLAEDTGYYSWTEGMIESVIPQEQRSSLYDAVNVMLKNMFNSRAQFSFVKAINKVIYNKPATIVLWADGTKTTAKCAEGETFDPEKGLVICALKKFVSADAIMNLLQFAKEGNGTVTYKDVLNKKKVVKKSDKTQVITVDCTNKSTAQVKAEIQKIQKKTKRGDK